MNPATYDIHIRGLVQGVGFRPFIYRLAKEMRMKGWVENRNDGVWIRVTCTGSALNDFINCIRKEAPEASEIFSIEFKELSPEVIDDFRIIKSRNISDDITEISPDIAVCKDCLEDMKHQPHRMDYPFINCTNCGPRFTIIRDLPYDREKTSMEPFVMCDECHTEYSSVLDRRFHAQPVACNNCGPSYELLEDGKSIHDLQQILVRICFLLENGRIVTIKGMGGFFIACDATNQQTVSRLRALKKREGKPFAVMCASLEAAREYAHLDTEEEKLLSSWRRPIVLLRERAKLAPDVSVGFDTVGIMLPYMPFHYLLFERLKLNVIVLTSGNLSDEPILIDNNRTIEQLSHSTDAILIYNREIYNRTDDSVTMVVNGAERLIRRSRGYVPAPVRLSLPVDGIFASGAELVNCFCIGKDHQAYLSQHIGDLKNMETYSFYRESAEHFSRMFRFTPDVAAADLHPDYLSSRFAHELGIPVTGIQHHHAHIASCLAEHGLDEPVIGVAFDGVGYGDDGHIWGGEFLICGLDNYQRYTHFDYVPMPGGDRATEEPWRMAVSYLYRTFGRTFMELDLPFLRHIPSEILELVLAAIEQRINCPLTSSAGRLFDAVSALTGLCTVAGFHAEAPMRLEAATDGQIKEYYEVVMDQTIHFESMIEAMVKDMVKGISSSVISAKFHNTVVESSLQVVTRMRSDSAIHKVALSGGSFQNRFLLSRLENRLHQNGFEVYSNRRVPANDGGIALGQLAVAAKRRMIGSNV